MRHMLTHYYTRTHVQTKACEDLQASQYIHTFMYPFMHSLHCEIQKTAIRKMEMKCNAIDYMLFFISTTFISTASLRFRPIITSSLASFLYANFAISLLKFKTFQADLGMFKILFNLVIILINFFLIWLVGVIRKQILPINRNLQKSIGLAQLELYF